jgi:hypothetical protein
MLLQYVADMLFFKRNHDGTYYNGELSDFIYALSLWSFFASIYLFARAGQRAEGAIEPR